MRMNFTKLLNSATKYVRIHHYSAFSLSAMHPHKREHVMVNPLDWNVIVEEAEKIVGYPTSFMNLRWLLSDELANVAAHLRKLVGSEHPLLKSGRDLFFQNDLPSWGLIVLLVSKAIGFKSNSPEPQNIAAGVLHSQRALAEITEMIRKSILIHKGLLNFSSSEKNSDILNFGNKMALLCGDYLLCKSYHELAELRNQEVNELISSALRDLVDCEFVGPRDNQNKPLPAKPDKKAGFIATEIATESHITPINVKNALGNAKAEWTARNILGGASLLGRSCQCTINLAGYGDDHQQMGYRFGKHLALAWQAWIDKNSITNWNFGPFNLVSAPVLFHLQHEPAVYEEIERGYEDVNDVDYVKLHKIISSGPGLSQTCELQWQQSKIALEMLEMFPANDARNALLNIINVLKQP